MSSAANFSSSEFHALEATVRAMSSLSMASSLFVLTTFLGSNLFQTPINRLIFYATFGNIFANIATMIARDSVIEGGDDTNALCQFQGFFLQWFVGGDALWVFCMALNVYLTLFRHYTPRDLRKLEWRYLIACYGMPFVPAVVLLSIRTSGGPIYGRSTLWCWTKQQFTGYRIGLFYGPVWFIIILTFAVLLYAAKEILTSRRHVKRATTDQVSPSSNLTGATVQPTWTMQPDNRIVEPEPTGNDAAGEVNREVREPVDDVSPTTTVGSADHQAINEPETDPSPAINTAADSTSNPPHHTAPRNSPRFSPHSTPQAEAEPFPSPHANGSAFVTGAGPRDVIFGPTPPRRGPGYDLEPQINLSPRVSMRQDRSRSSGESTIQRRASIERRTAAYLYSKRAVLFFIALLMTWIPPSINRVYLISKPDNASFALSYLEGLTIPLQGFWNCVIYVVTSMDAVKALWVMATSTITHAVLGTLGNERRPSWESALQRARRKRREMSLVNTEEGLEMGRRSETTPAGPGLAGQRRSSQETRESIWGAKWLGRWFDRMSDAGSAARRSSLESWSRWMERLGKRSRSFSVAGPASAPAGEDVSGSPVPAVTPGSPVDDGPHPEHVSAPPAFATQVIPGEIQPPTRASSPSNGSSGSASKSPEGPLAGSSSPARSCDDDTRNDDYRADTESRHNDSNV